MTTFAPELAPNIDNTPKSEIHFREGVGIVLGTAAVDSLITVLPIERAEELFAQAVSATDNVITITFSQAQSLAAALRPPEDVSWRDDDLTDKQMFVTWDLAKATQLYGRLREGLQPDTRPLYMRESTRDIAAEAQKRDLYSELSGAAHALAAAAIGQVSDMKASATINAEQITAVYDAYPGYFILSQEVRVDEDVTSLAEFAAQQAPLAEAAGLGMSA
jgi:hypothetical protein